MCLLKIQVIHGQPATIEFVRGSSVDCATSGHQHQAEVQYQWAATHCMSASVLAGSISSAEFCDCLAVKPVCKNERNSLASRVKPS